MFYQWDILSGLKLQAMRNKFEQGNSIIEFLIYILICIIFVTLFIDFYVISKKINEANKFANFLTISISKNNFTAQKWLNTEVQEKLIKTHSLEGFSFDFRCLPNTCSSRSNFVEITVYGKLKLVGINFPYSVTKKANISRYISQ
jgi:hypothetical protein